MVAQTIQRGTDSFRGVRPINPPHDLRQVALLLEESFRQDLGALHSWSRIPLVREIGATLIATAFMPVPTENLRGFVYEENGRILGNVTLTLDDGRERRWMISNVAVSEKFRRHGIARQLMLAAIDEARARGAQWLILNVRPWNEGAIRLYAALGFDTIDTETQYARTRAHTLGAEPLPIRPLKKNELRAGFDVARSGMSERLRMFRPLSASEFGLKLEDRFAESALDFFILQSTQRFGYFDKDVLVATITLRAQRLGTPHKLSIYVLPAVRGQLENHLVAAALQQLNTFPPRDVETRALASHGALVRAYADAGFIPTRGLTLMAKGFR